jgi:hypothetical protein
MAGHPADKVEHLTRVLYSRERLSKAATAFHLDIDRGTLPDVAAKLGLEAEGGRYPWRRIFRVIHKVEPTKIAGWLAQAKADGLPGLGDIEDLERALKEPLIDFDVMARALGWKPDTLSNAMCEGRFVLPFPTFELGPRLRRYRPLDVRLWRDAEVRLDLPEPYQPPASAPTATTCTAEALPRRCGRTCRGNATTGTAEAALGEAVFGVFGAVAPEKRNAAG